MKKYLVLVIAFVVLVSVPLYYVLSTKSPKVEGLAELEKLPKKKELHLKVTSNRKIHSVKITISQGGKVVELVNVSPNANGVEFPLIVEPRKLSIADGEAEVSVFAKAGFLAKTQMKFKSIVKTTPPMVSVIDNSYLADQGSSAAVLINAKDASRVYVKEGEKTFAATNSIFDDKSRYFCIYPIDTELPLNTAITVVAEDDVGNRSQSAIKTILKRTIWRQDTLKISDDFIRRVVNPLLGDENLPPVESFIKVNEHLRQESENKVKEITKKSADKILWDGPFIQLPNSQVFAHFGDKRSYEYDGKIVSHSIHYGFDLATIANHPVEASNSGVVVYAGELGIYGNAIIIDHGLDLFSLYGHLSSVGVSQGQQVKKHEVIGKSGMTGFAGGDHLHFAILDHGQYVNPVHWWDKMWIEKRVLNVLKSKG
ncbi:MAG: M23 family metallopeptidase [Nitrospirae bacterium]|nr:M23 family metallopeptidase [Nitrospirota bacterium]